MAREKLYIAYGSNINLSQMTFRCPTATRFATGMVHNYELEFRGVATIVPKQDSDVPVLCWKIKPGDEQRLDVYEGFPRMYRKETIPVEICGKMYDGMVYVMNGGQIHPPCLNYYQCIYDGYKANGIDTRYLMEAADRAYELSQENKSQLTLNDFNLG